MELKHGVAWPVIQKGFWPTVPKSFPLSEPEEAMRYHFNRDAQLGRSLWVWPGIYRFQICATKLHQKHSPSAGCPSSSVEWMQPS